MTREEQIEMLKEEYEDCAGDDSYTQEWLETLDAAIKALEQEPFINKTCVSSKVCEHDKQKVLDKIRTEIKQLRNFRAENYDLEKYCACFDARIIFRDDVFEILDKYKAESEVKK